MKRTKNEITFRWTKDKVQLWKLLDGENNFRLNYDIVDSDIVMDLGGYKGDWTKRIFEKYNCNVLIFEPVEDFYEEIKNKFSEEEKVKAFKFGLGPKNSSENIFLSGDSSSMISKTGAKTTIEIKSAKEFLEKEDIKKVKLVKINIEGAEYELLEHLIDNDLCETFENIQVQFHKFIPDHEERRLEISKKLSSTHEITYNFDMVWENWRLKK